MNWQSPFSAYIARLRDFISCQTDLLPVGCGEDAIFEPLALELFGLQSSHNPAYRRFCEARGSSPRDLEDWRLIPAMPAAGFKELEMTSLPPEQRSRVFHSSGTSEHRPSRHFHDAESLALYEASLLPWFQKHLLGAFGAMGESRDHAPGLSFLFLTPSPELAPHSSLVHMFATIRGNVRPAEAQFAGTIGGDGGWVVDVDRAVEFLRNSIAVDRPVVILGTAFGFVHLLDWMEQQNVGLKLPEGSRVLETGGYKNRSRSMPKAELHSLISDKLGVPAGCIVSEYGMSELSSQAYDMVAGASSNEFIHIMARTEALKRSPSTALRAPSPPLGKKDGMRGNAASRVFHFPPWARVQIVSPETGLEVRDGETGLIRVFDLANVRSVMAVQTEDLGVRRGSGFELLGRAALAEPRGCSLMSL